MLGLANILPVGKLQGEELWQGLDAIGQNARNHAPLVEDLLDMSRIMSGKGRLEIQLIDVSAILKESIETLPAMAEAKGVRLQAVMHPYAVPISGSACSKR